MSMGLEGGKISCPWTLLLDFATFIVRSLLYNFGVDEAI